MKLYLAKSAKVSLDGYQGAKRSVYLPINGLTTYHRDSSEEQQLCKQFRQHVNRYYTNRSLGASVSFNASASGSGLTIYGDAINALQECFGSEVQLQVELVRLQDVHTGKKFKNVRSKVMNIFKTLWDLTKTEDSEFPENNDDLKTALKNGGLLEGTLNLVVIVKEMAEQSDSGNEQSWVNEQTVEPIGSQEELMTMNRKILQEEVASDLIIIPENGSSVKGHKAFLSVNSEVFKAMFLRSGMEETKTDTLEMPDMSEEGVKALLAYLYYRDENEAKIKSRVAFELLSAGHKYIIPVLEADMRKLLLGKDEDWYEMDIGMKLFLFAKNLPENGEELKEKAVKVLKVNLALLRQSLAYQKLFKENPEAAMELCEYAFEA